MVKGRKYHNSYDNFISCCKLCDKKFYGKENATKKQLELHLKLIHKERCTSLDTFNISTNTDGDPNGKYRNHSQILKDIDSLETRKLN